MKTNKLLSANCIESKNKLNAIYGINGRKPCDLGPLYRQYILARADACIIDTDSKVLYC